MKRPEPASLPLTPGVYLYKDDKGRIIYVGKARVLRRRILSYFREDGLPVKTRAMLAHAVSIDTLSTTTEKEALLLEASLIKKHRPHYNIVLRDDKQYCLFRINLKQDFPRLEIVRQAKRDGATYFGPFTSALAARDTWKLLHRAFHLRRCSDRAMRNRVRACLYHHMGQCPAPCMGDISREDYHKAVSQVRSLLDGHAEALLHDLQVEMEAASEALEFERAATLRDQMRAVERTVERQAAVMPGKSDMDALGIFDGQKGLALGMVFVRGGQVIDGRGFYWPGLALEDATELVPTFLSQYYGQALPPARILVPWLTPALRPAASAETVGRDGARTSDDDNGDALLEALADKRGGAVRLVAPQNASDNQLVDLARANAREAARRNEGMDGDSLLEKVGRALHLPAPPQRIECVDVSHTSGKQTRVGMVVYENGRPCKEAYRTYAMPDSDDDYATLHAWIARRIESGPPWPDLLLIDGGRGQLSAVGRALTEAGHAGLFPLAGIAKARDEQGHADRRAGNVADRIFLPGRSNPLPLKGGCAELLLLQQIRDATHGFAISRHRRARRNVAMTGELMRLPGIGPTTARLLWDHFENVSAMRQATLEELAALPGIGKKKALNIQEKLKKLS